MAWYDKFVGNEEVLEENPKIVKTFEKTKSKEDEDSR